MKLSTYWSYVVFALCAFQWVCPSGIAQEKPDDIPTDIETVISGGYWKQGQDEGQFRLILKLEGWEHLANRAFLQWMKQDTETRTNIVVTTLPVRQINDGHWRITGPGFTLKKKSWVLSMKGQSTYGNETRLFSIVFSPDFQYSLTEVPSGKHAPK